MNKLKIINANYGAIHQYINIKTKLLSCNADIYFNRQCIHKRVIPTYAQSTMPEISPAARSTKQKTQILRIKEEIKFLHRKKQHLNEKLYHQHFLLANS